MNLLYIRKILTLVATLLIAIISLNYFVDPGAIYYRSGGNFPDMYAKSLLNSDNGLLWSSNTISDRELALGLSSHVETTDCVIIGSSNVMQIGTYGESRSLDATCNTILNLAVSGGEIADHLILTYLAIKNGSPKKIILGVGAWTLAKESELMDSSVKQSNRYSSNYHDAQLVILNSIQKDKISLAKYLNLINLEYTKKSISLLKKSIIGNNLFTGIQNVTKKVDVLIGTESAVRLPDGSLVYPSAYINMARETPIPKDYFYYKNRVGSRSGMLVSNPYFIDIYDRILSYILESGVVPIVILTPYHENLWKFNDSNIVMAMSKNEEIIRQLGKKLGVSVIGSYNPKNLGCESNEFYDFQHPTRECLSRIKREEKSKK
jgi:hypothetical protein